MNYQLDTEVITLKCPTTSIFSRSRTNFEFRQHVRIRQYGLRECGFRECNLLISILHKPMQRLDMKKSNLTTWSSFSLPITLSSPLCPSVPHYFHPFEARRPTQRHGSSSTRRLFPRRRCQRCHLPIPMPISPSHTLRHPRICVLRCTI